MFPAELEDRYELIRPLGEGGYGSVYLVKDRRLGRELALKVLDGIAADPEQAERFRREARVTAQLQHPNVVRVFDHGDLAGGRAFIGYEYVEGHDLTAVLERREAVPLAQLLTWGTAIASALQAAHDKGITHRDLKPANVLLRSDGQALLCDFGVARLAEGGTVQTREGLILGTPSYVAPEIWYGAAPGPPADQFSLAATLYELLYRRRPFPSDEPTEIWQALKAGWRPAPPSDRQGEHPVLERTLMRALAPRPESRYASVGDFGRALTQTEGTHGFRASQGDGRLGATKVITAPAETLTQPGGVTRKTRRPALSRTHAWPPRRTAGAASAGAAVAVILLWLAWPSAEPRPAAPATAPRASPPWADQLANLRSARDRLPQILQRAPGGRLRRHVQASLRELVDPRVELGLNRFLEAQVTWLRAVAEAGDGWERQPVREALVAEVLGPLYGISAVFATLQHHGSRVVFGGFDLEEVGMDRGDFLHAMLTQKERLLERLGTHAEALDGVSQEPPVALSMGRAFLTLFFLRDFRNPHVEGHQREPFAQQALRWLEEIPEGDPKARFAIRLVGWVALHAVYGGFECPLRTKLARRLHARALASEGEEGVALETSLQALVRGGMIVARVLSSCPEAPAPELHAQLDEIIGVLSAHGEEHPELVRDLARELQELIHGRGRRGRKKRPEMEARIERLRALRAELGA